MPIPQSSEVCPFSSLIRSVEHLLSTYCVRASVAGPGAIAEKDNLYSVSHGRQELGKESVGCVRDEMGACRTEAPPGGGLKAKT